MSTSPTRNLETFENPRISRNYLVRMECPEFTCLCPMTGQPDFATIRVRYVPDQICVELKSFKLYLWSFREAAAFHEDITNQILEDLVEALGPRFLEVGAEFRVRGGIFTTVLVRHGDPTLG